MKKILLVLAVCSVIAACGGNSKSGSGDTSTTGANQDAKAQESNADTNSNKTGTEGASMSPGAKLIASNDCLTCHKIDSKVIGPSFNDIAAKYPSNEANIDTLANKVIKGGKGNWGDVPMTAHPALALADAKTIVTYILSLKK
jgi:cytochrome c